MQKDSHPMGESICTKCKQTRGCWSPASPTDGQDFQGAMEKKQVSCGDTLGSLQAQDDMLSTDIKVLPQRVMHHF
eukprot:742761-Pelagomonas_calceolata.AAC.1